MLKILGLLVCGAIIGIFGFGAYLVWKFRDVMK